MGYDGEGDEDLKTWNDFSNAFVGSLRGQEGAVIATRVLESTSLLLFLKEKRNLLEKGAKYSLRGSPKIVQNNADQIPNSLGLARLRTFWNAHWINRDQSI